MAHNRDAARYSGDIDIFHDREERVARAAEEDASLLEEHGYGIEWQRREPAIYSVLAEGVWEKSAVIRRIRWPSGGR